MTSPTLTPAGRAVLVQLVSGAKLDHVPGELVELKLVESARFKMQGNVVGLFWVATKAGRMEAARGDE